MKRASVWWGVALAALVVSCKGGSGTASAGNSDMSGADIKELFAGKTVTGHHEVKNYDFESYYEPDGKLRSYQGAGKKLREADWNIKGQDICLHWKDTGTVRCRRMVKGADGVYRKEKVKKNGDRKVVVTFKSFVDGNPNKL